MLSSMEAVKSFQVINRLSLHDYKYSSILNLYQESMSSLKEKVLVNVKSRYQLSLDDNPRVME